MLSPSYETGTLDKLYLEWSQFTKARTHRELEGMWQRTPPPLSEARILVAYLNTDGSIAYALDAYWSHEQEKWITLLEHLDVPLGPPPWNAWMRVPEART